MTECQTEFGGTGGARKGGDRERARYGGGGHVHSDLAVRMKMKCGWWLLAISDKLPARTTLRAWTGSFPEDSIHAFIHVDACSVVFPRAGRSISSVAAPPVGERTYTHTHILEYTHTP